MESEIESEGMSWGLWLALGGLVVGAVAGLLLAPKGGKETRDEIDEWAQRNRRRAQSWLNSAGNVLPTRVKVAAGVGAVRGGMAEAFDVAKDKSKDFIGNR